MQQASQIQTLFHQARDAYARRQYAQCVFLCDQLTRKLGPREEMLNLKALALLAQGRAREAAKALARALKLNPSSPGMHMNAARAELVLGDFRAAKRHATEAVRLAPREAPILYQAAIGARQRGDYGEAMRLVDRCQQIAPSLVEARHLKGSMLLDLGETEAAKQELERAVAVDPNHARSLADLARVRGTIEDNEDLLPRLHQLAHNASDPWDRSTALFTLADLHHRAGDYDRAGGLYQEANATGKRVRPFDLGQWEARQAATLSRAADLEAEGKPGHGDGAHLVFLVGMPRSGTSLCERIIGAHSQALACGELPLMEAVERHSPPGATPAARRNAYLAGLPRDHFNYAVVTDKLPMNFERVGLIHRLFPGARFIHCRRDPLDAIWSCFQQDFQSGVQWAFDLDEITRVFLAQQRLMAHWAKCLPEHVLALDYERLVTDLEGETERLASFLGLEVEPAMLEPHRNAGLVRTASRLQVRESVYSSSIGKWRHYESLLGGPASTLAASAVDS